MHNFFKALKDNKKLLIVAFLVISIAIGFVIYDKIKLEPTYNPEISENNDVGYIKKNYKVNEYSVVNMTELDLLNAYLKKYLRYASTNPEKAYEMLSASSKESFNNDFNKYKEYLSENTSIYTKDNEVTKFRTGKEIYTYDIVDSEKYKYIIHEKATWNIEITLNGRE